MSNSILDDIAAEVGTMTDEEIKVAAEAIQERKLKAAARVTPESKQKMKDREKKRRMTQSAILKLAKEKGLVSEVHAAQAASQETVQ